MSKDDMTELDHSLQIESVSSAPSQTTSAREILKAGQRRLWQLAQRQWKATDPNTKVEEASRYLHALQEEVFLPLSEPKKPGPKMNSEPAKFGSRATTNFNFKSSSRRDVEQIGQPWLENPLEISDTHDSLGGELSALDLGQLTSLVEAVVASPPRFNDANSPPDQSLVNTSNGQQAGTSESRQHTGARRELAPSFEPNGRQCDEQVGSAPTNPEQENKGNRDQIPAVLVPGKRSSSSDKTKHKKSQASDALATKDNPVQPREKSTSSKPAAPRDGPTPSVQTLKLFPDTLPPRISSKSALRIPNSRVLGKEAGNSAMAPGAQQKRGPVTTKSKAEKSYLMPMTLPEHQHESEKSSDSSSSKSGKPCSEPARSPIYPNFPLPNNSRRPASLPMGTIDSFPLPAPKRPLPSLPEPISALNTARHQSIPASHKMHRDSDNPLETVPATKACSTNKTGKCLSANNQAALPRLRFDEKDLRTYQQDDSKEETIPMPYGEESFVKAGQSREERVRALRQRDMVANRVYIKGPETPHTEKKNQTIDSPGSPRSLGRGPYSSDSNETSSQPWGGDRRDASSSIPASPPRLPLPAQLGREMSFDRRHCSSPTDFIKVLGERREPSSLPVSKRSSLLDCSNSTRSTGVLYEMAAGTSNISKRAESPLPSSDDECMGNNAPASELRQAISKNFRRRAQHTFEDLSLNRSRNSKTPTIPSHVEPLTPRRQSSRGFENFSPQSHNSRSSYSSHGLPGQSNNAVHALNSLEGRIAQLEHQNKILQAALFAALDAGVKHNLEGVPGGLTTSGSAAASSSGAERSSLSSTDRSTRGHRRTRSARHSRMKKTVRRPESWIDSPGSSNQSDYQSDDSLGVRDLEDMIEDLEVNWMTEEPKTRRM
ncbi:uncharacterized protein ACLA_098490 [Aspergillus clavatus NRRL 1]|uniref:Uncharacterized protein n=1 Tax=Aspergillus clavatus (strain ATCC 1007 / CBS 513.65 / DSM 816 / NCTC 3887 / NRRL 1 / QM 1276 / 107) TaxID=344612 RepID=A1CMX0_ASPCL|nr:uncharacterized protein ACLA_098490 [Aspergillus clavatus NRRL 1]EAW08907.1 conserved hypothetical protein [Aspergillus clavatus NRRL 1]